MPKAERRYRSVELLFVSAVLAAACAAQRAKVGAASATSASPRAASSRAEAACPAAPVTAAEVRPLIDEYCVSCHSPGGAAGEDFDFRSDAAITLRRRNIEAKLRLHVMPPPNARQPSAADRAALRCWAKG